MKAIIFALSALVSAISSADNINKYSFDKFKTITLGIELNELVKTLGDPSSKETLKVADENFILWDYKDGSRTRFEFLIDPQNKVVSQKIFFPLPKSPEANIKNLLEQEFKTSSFKKINTTCAHYGEFAYVDTLSGLFILTRESDRHIAPATAISWSNPKTSQLQLKENRDRKCQK